MFEKPWIRVLERTWEHDNYVFEYLLILTAVFFVLCDSAKSHRTRSFCSETESSTAQDLSVCQRSNFSRSVEIPKHPLQDVEKYRQTIRIFQ